MIAFAASSVAPSILAVITTVHLALLLLRKHRNPKGVRHDALLIPSLAFVATPWLLTTPIGLAAGLFLHIGWLMACDYLIPADITAAAPAAVTPPPVQAPSPPRDPRPAAPKGFVQTPIMAVLRESPDITTFRMARPRGFDFEAGQFLTVRVNVDGSPVARCYSVSSSPEASGYLEISVKRQGLVSGTLHAAVRPGSMIEVRRPAGAFTYPAADNRPITLLAGGIGITPLMSMLRHGAQADPARPINLIYSVTTHRDVVFRDELRWLAQRHPNLNVVITATRGPHSTEHLSGRIDRRMLEERVADLSDNIFMICGPGPMIETMGSILAELEVPSDQVRSEAFEAAAAAANRTEEVPPSAEVAAADKGASFELRLVSSGRTVAATGGSSLLETCEAAGVEIPSACRAGVCGTCRVRLVDGPVRCESELLDDADQSQGYILPCVSWPEGDCALEA